MKKAVVMMLLLMPGLFLAGCASTGNDGDMKAASHAKAGNTSYQSGYSNKLSSRRHQS